MPKHDNRAPSDASPEDEDPAESGELEERIERLELRIESLIHILEARLGALNVAE